MGFHHFSSSQLALDQDFRPFGPGQMSIDDWLGFMDTDEVLEVTPVECRLAKKTAMKAPGGPGGSLFRHEIWGCYTQTSCFDIIGNHSYNERSIIM